MSLTVISGYRFFPIQDPARHKPELIELTHSLNLKGSIFLSEEGLNLSLAGSAADISDFKNLLEKKFKFPKLEFHEYQTRKFPFSKVRVRVKKDLLNLKNLQSLPYEGTGRRLKPAELKNWIDQKKDFYLLDARNSYEVKLGTFKGAKHLSVRTFKEFIERSDSLPSEAKQKPMVMYCTGGIRCEKASSIYLRELGFQEVYQLEGGILAYFAQVGGEHFEGECLVFDDRVSLDPKAAEARKCSECLSPLSTEDLASEDFLPFRRCPHCVPKSTSAKLT